MSPLSQVVALAIAVVAACFGALHLEAVLERTREMAGAIIGVMGAFIVALVAFYLRTRDDEKRRRVKALYLLVGVCTEMDRILDRIWKIIHWDGTGHLSSAPILMDAKEQSLAVLISTMEGPSEPILGFYENAGFIAFHHNRALELPDATLVLGEDTTPNIDVLRRIVFSSDSELVVMLGDREGEIQQVTIPINDLTRQVALEQLKRVRGQVQAIGFAREKYESMIGLYEQAHAHLSNEAHAIQKHRELATDLQRLQPMDRKTKLERVNEAKNPSRLKDRLRRVMIEQARQDSALDWE